MQTDDIPYTFSDETVPPTPAAPYPETTLEDFVARLPRCVWKLRIDADRVIRRPKSALRKIDRAYARVARELLDAYGLPDVVVALVYNVGHQAFVGVYWTPEEAEANLGDPRPTIALNMYLARYTPVRAMHDTILHEIAHALCRSGDHDAEWRSIAVAIGCSGRVYAGQVDPDYLPENRYDGAVVFRCREGCYVCYGKIVAGDRSIVGDLAADCDPTTGELLNPNERCSKHGLPLFLFPPPSGTATPGEYIEQLRTEHEHLSAALLT